MKHILEFNNEIQDLMILNPEDKTLKLIEDYRNKRKYSDYYRALDSFGFEIKFSFVVISSVNDKYIPCVKYYPKNSFGENSRTIQLVEEDNAFNSLDKCYKYLAKEYVYRLMNLPNLEMVIS